MSFFSKLPATPLRDESEEQRITRFKRMQWASFIAITLGYSMYYVCRTSLNVVKKPIMDAGILDARQLGVISSALLFTYAIGKFVNGFLADHSNIRRFMATGLLISTVANIVVGLLGLITVSQMAISQVAFYIIFAILWALNGWTQSMGAPPSIVALSRWYPLSNRGTFYGFFSASQAARTCQPFQLAIRVCRRGNCWIHRIPFDCFSAARFAGSGRNAFRGGHGGRGTTF